MQTSQSCTLIVNSFSTPNFLEGSSYLKPVLTKPQYQNSFGDHHDSNVQNTDSIPKVYTATEDRIEKSDKGGWGDVKSRLEE